MFCTEHPKRDHILKFTPLSETTSIPAPFIWESPPPPTPGPLPSDWSVFDMIIEGVNIFDEFRMLQRLLWIVTEQKPGKLKLNLIVNSKIETTLIKKRTHHRSTCQAFPCDNQYRAVDTTLSWSAWGMVLLLAIERKKNLIITRITYRWI